jgi:hypothetical protein
VKGKAVHGIVSLLAILPLVACSVDTRNEHEARASIPVETPSLVHISSDEAFNELWKTLSRAETSLLDYFQNQLETQDFSKVTVEKDKIFAFRAGSSDHIELTVGKPRREATGLSRAILEQNIRKNMSIAPQTSSNVLEEFIQTEVEVNTSDRYYYDLLSPEGRVLLILEIPSLYYEDSIRPVLFYRPNGDG